MVKLIKLIKPDIDYKEDIFKYKEEMFKSGADILEGCGGLDRYNSYEEWIDHLKSYENRNKIDPASGKVEGSQYMLVDEEAHRILGMINLRHYLNEKLRRTSGHIGYSVRPGERRKGYGKRQLKEALKIIKKLGVNDVLITCDTDNVASFKTIEACGGVLEKILYIKEFDCMTRRYWIHQ